MSYAGRNRAEILLGDQNPQLSYIAVCKKQILNIHELEEFRLDVYENSMIYKERIKKWHNKRISRKEFNEGDIVLLFNSRLKMFPGKLRSR